MTTGSAVLRAVRRTAGAVALTVLAAPTLVGLTTGSASAATGVGGAAHFSTRIDDPTNSLKRLGNRHRLELGVEVNPEGYYVFGQVYNYECSDPALFDSQCQKAGINTLLPTGAPTISIAGDGSAQVTAALVEVRTRDAKELRRFNAVFTIGEGVLVLRQNCGGAGCGFVSSNGGSWVQQRFQKQWATTSATTPLPSIVGNVGNFDLSAGIETSTNTTKYWVRTSTPQ